MAAVFSACNRAAVFVSMVATFVMMASTAADAMGRYLLNSPVRGAVEFTEEYLLVTLVFLAINYTYGEGGLVRVTFFLRRVPSGARLYVNYAAQIITTLAALTMLTGVIIHTTRAQAANSISNGPYAYVIWPAYVIVGVGLALICIHLLADLPKVASGRSSMLLEKELE